MGIKEFWELIEETHSASGGDDEKQAGLIIAELVKLTETEIVEYSDIFDDLNDEAYIADLWVMAFILGGGCGDDGFMDFRAWLIGQGKEIYEKALIDPDSLIDYVKLGQKTKSEFLLYAAQEAYDIKMGKETLIPSTKPFKPTPKLKGTILVDTDNDVELLKIFPRAAKFLEWWDDPKNWAF